MSNESKLISGARTFDEDALANIYDEYSPGLYQYAYRHCGDANRAEDCVAETFSRFLQALKKGGGPSKHLQAYLYRTAHNWIADTYRRQPPPNEELKDNLNLAGQTQPEDTVEATLEFDVVRTAITKLTKDQQQVIGLKFLEGWNNKEIANSVGKPVGAVKALQSRGLASLKRILQDENILR